MERKYIERDDSPPLSDEWKRDVNGAKLLEDIVDTLSMQLLRYQKTIHTPMLIERADQLGLADIARSLRRGLRGHRPRQRRAVRASASGFNQSGMR